MNDSLKPMRIGSHGTIFYAPQYIAKSRGYFEDVGLDVTLLRDFGGYDLTTALKKKEVDMFAGSPWFPFRFGGDPVNLRAIAQMCRHCRYVLASRPGEDGFEAPSKRNNGADLTVLVPSATPPPVWVSMLTGLRLKGLHTGQINFVSGFNAADAAEQFLQGLGDVLLMGIEPADQENFGEKLILAEAIGPIAWTVYCATVPMIDERHEDLLAFRSALQRGQEWVASHTGDEIAEELEATLSDFSLESRKRVVSLYERLDNWTTTPAVNHEELNRWQDYLVKGGLLTDPVDVTTLTPFD